MPFKKFLKNSPSKQNLPSEYPDTPKGEVHALLHTNLYQVIAFTYPLAQSHTRVPAATACPRQI